MASKNFGNTGDDNFGNEEDNDCYQNHSNNNGYSDNHSDKLSTITSVESTCSTEDPLHNGMLKLHMHRDRMIWNIKHSWKGLFSKIEPLRYEEYFELIWI